MTDLAPQTNTYPMPAHGWTCFHCGETFKTPGSARNHFGATPEARPECLIKNEPGLLFELRQAEAEITRLREQETKMLQKLEDCIRINRLERSARIGKLSLQERLCRTILNLHDLLTGKDSK